MPRAPIIHINNFECKVTIFPREKGKRRVFLILFNSSNYVRAKKSRGKSFHRLFFHSVRFSLTPFSPLILRGVGGEALSLHTGSATGVAARAVVIALLRLLNSTRVITGHSLNHITVTVVTGNLDGSPCPDRASNTGQAP